MQTRGLGLPRSGAVRRRPGVVPRAAVARLVHPLEAPRPLSRRAPSPARYGWLWALPFSLLALWILRHFIEPLAWAVIVAIVTWPLYRLFARRLGATTSSGLAALAFTALVSVFVFAPMVFAFGALFAEAGRLVAWLQTLDHTGVAIPRWLEALPLVGGAASEPWRAVLGSPGGVSAWLQRIDASALLGWAQTLGRFMERHFFIGFFMVFALFFAYRDGETFADVLGRVVAERFDSRAPRYMALAVRAIRATVGLHGPRRACPLRRDVAGRDPGSHAAPLSCRRRLRSRG